LSAHLLTVTFYQLYTDTLKHTNTQSQYNVDCKMILTPIQVANVVTVCVLWGCTNPFLRRGSMENDNSQDKSEKMTTCQWFISLWSSWQFILPFLLNQAGSAFYAILLGQMDLTLALPLCNSLAFVLTAVTGYFLGEKVESPLILCLGTACVLSGTALCVWSQNAVDVNV
jgi:hypothetical protein